MFLFVVFELKEGRERKSIPLEKKKKKKKKKKKQNKKKYSAKIFEKAKLHQKRAKTFNIVIKNKRKAIRIL